jgi:SM-20-related protein
MMTGPSPKPAPFPPGPNPPGPGIVGGSQAQLGSVAIGEMPEVLAAECVVLEEFLAPAELNALCQYVFDHEADFQLSEVISPGVTSGIVDHEYRRSRVLMNLGDHQAVVVNRLQSCWPSILSRLDRAAFVASQVEAQITASNDGDFFHWHSDNGHEINAPREITFVYFFHREPKNFRGGELRIYDSRREGGSYVPMENYRTIVPQQNQIVLFPSSLAHEITPVECSSKAFADSRFTVNGWFHK